MNRFEYFKAALKSDAILKKEWVLSVFTVARFADDRQREEYPYRIKREQDGVYFLNPEGAYELIEGVGPDEDVLHPQDSIKITPADMPNYSGPEIHTRAGTAFCNMLVLVRSFGNLIPYINGYVRSRDIENQIEKLLVDDADQTEGKIQVKKYLEAAEAAMSLVGYNAVFVTSVTPKTLFGHPMAQQLRAELMEKFAGQLTDPAIIAQFNSAFEALDREWLKDDPAMDFYINDKYFNAIRMKMFYMFGAENAFGDGSTVTFLPKSLAEGIDVKELPAMINSLREGSYNRGAQTQLGGSKAKDIYRMMGTVAITGPDCGSKLGIPMRITKSNVSRIVGHYYIVNKVSHEITNENAASFLDQILELRDPLTCKQSGKNVCVKCIGKRLAENEHGLGAACGNLGGRFLTAFLKKMHASALKTKKYDFKKRIS